MSWFKRLVGFSEEDPDQVRANLRIEEGVLHSTVNGQSYRCGALETPTLASLREVPPAILLRESAPISISEVVGDVQDLHRNPASNGALFQVASQFNLLEMVGPGVPPEHGVEIYAYDATQGPACAIACGAATIYRNYFAEVDGQIGQTASKQIDCLVDVGEALGNSKREFWEMRNGYALASKEGLEMIRNLVESGGEEAADRLRSKLRIGVQWLADVTLGGSPEKECNLVTQAFCSALPVAYSHVDSTSWEPFARLILEGAYEATLHAALLNRELTGSAQVYLTLLGGGAFGNPSRWIIDAMERAFRLFEGSGLDVKIVSYGGRSPEVQSLLT